MFYFLRPHFSHSVERTQARIAADEVPTLRERNLTLANTIEDLHAQLERKAAEERYFPPFSFLLTPNET